MENASKKILKFDEIKIYVLQYLNVKKGTIFWFNNNNIQAIFHDLTQLLFYKDYITYIDLDKKQKCFKANE
jgi:hypothetical protein